MKKSLQRFKNYSKEHQESSSKGTKLSSDTNLVTDDAFKYIFKKSCNDNSHYTFPDVDATILATISDNEIVVSDSYQSDSETLKMHKDIESNDYPTFAKVLGLITDKTNFYTAAGGQCCDTGVIELLGRSNVHLKVINTEKLDNVVVHFCDLRQFQRYIFLKIYFILFNKFSS